MLHVALSSATANTWIGAAFAADSTLRDGRRSPHACQLSSGAGTENLSNPGVTTPRPPPSPLPTPDAIPPRSPHHPPPATRDPAPPLPRGAMRGGAAWCGVRGRRVHACMRLPSGSAGNPHARPPPCFHLPATKGGGGRARGFAGWGPIHARSYTRISVTRFIVNLIPRDVEI